MSTKFIERVFIGAAGDPSVGIPASNFEMTVWIDPAEDLTLWRSKIAALYDDMIGETVAVLFDFEYEKMCERKGS